MSVNDKESISFPNEKMKKKILKMEGEGKHTLVYSQNRIPSAGREAQIGT